ncbi:MAG: arylsulfatase [Cytophagales bacterium]|nr:arylsulfatase [Cytophagales bacterium]
MKINAIISVLLIVVFGNCLNTKEERKPNIILIMTDDQGYGDLACHGNPWIKTPEMDKLYAQSVRLTDFHVGTTCAPTRAGLLTGRNCNEVGVWHTIIGRNFLRQGEVTLADILRKNGYSTGIFGKWHLGDNYPYLPQYRGFEETLIHGGGGVGQTPDYWNNDYFDDTYFRNGVPEKFNGYCTDIWFDEALKFIESRKDESFFCYIAPNAPHGPFHVPQKYLDMYRENEEIPNPNFYGMITNIDDNLGVLRKKLEAWNISENTILIFMTDNGTSSGIRLDKKGFPAGKGFNAGMRGKKGSAYEGGHRVPFFIHWPKGDLAHGSDVKYISSYTDVVPTLLDLCKVGYTPDLPFEGESLVSLLRNPGASWKSRTIITDTQRREFLEKWKDASIMTDEYRLIRGSALYEIKDDPGQTKDIAREKPEIVKSLRREYEAWWQRVSQRSDEINPIPVGFDSTPVALTCHDLHADEGAFPAWNQTQVRLNKNPNGFWIIDVKEKGKYSIELRRYPKEAGAGFNEAVPIGDDIDGGKPYPEGIPIAISSAKLRIGEKEETREVKSGAINVIFNFELEPGKQKLKSWLTDEQGIEVGAYYVYVQKM